VANGALAMLFSKALYMRFLGAIEWLLRGQRYQGKSVTGRSVGP